MQKSKADILMERLDKEFIKNGLEPPKRVTRTGSFIMVQVKTNKEVSDD